LAPGRVDLTAIDADGDGAHSRKELVTRASARIAVMDVDRDGQITRAQIIAARPARGSLHDVFAPDRA